MRALDGGRFDAFAAMEAQPEFPTKSANGGNEGPHLLGRRSADDRPRRDMPPPGQRLQRAEFHPRRGRIAGLQDKPRPDPLLRGRPCRIVVIQRTPRARLSRVGPKHAAERANVLADELTAHFAGVGKFDRGSGCRRSGFAHGVKE